MINDHLDCLARHPEGRRSAPPPTLLKFAALWVLGRVIFTFTGIWQVFGLGPFLLPIIPLTRFVHLQ